jgi:hypothetical protein
MRAAMTIFRLTASRDAARMVLIGKMSPANGP